MLQAGRFHREATRVAARFDFGASGRGTSLRDGLGACAPLELGAGTAGGKYVLLGMGQLLGRFA